MITIFVHYHHHHHAALSIAELSVLCGWLLQLERLGTQRVMTPHVVCNKIIQIFAVQINFSVDRIGLTSFLVTSYKAV